MGGNFIVLGGIGGGSLVVSLGGVSGAFGSGLVECIRYCIGLSVPGIIESCGASDTVSFLSNIN